MKLPFCGSAPHIRPRFRFSFFPANLFVPFEEVDGQSGGKKEFVIFKSQRASEDRYLVSVERSKGSRKSSKLVSKERKNVSFPRNHPLGPRPLHQAQARGKESRLIGFNETVKNSRPRNSLEESGTYSRPALQNRGRGTNVVPTPR